MSNIKISKPKAENPDRFSGAQDFAKGSAEEVAQAPITAEVAVKNKKITVPSTRKLIHKEPMYRENFEMEESLSFEMRDFLGQSRRFRKKRDFLIQCVKDGLKKYKDE